ncbi:MAG: hypothetical protein Q8876_03325 [Bacillota bacterium]|nr:hypothetical protein [Bacillota bacterium]
MAILLLVKKCFYKIFENSNDIKKKTIRFIGGCFVVVLALEVLVFNFQAYQLTSGEFTKMNVDLSKLNVSGFTVEGNNYTVNNDGYYFSPHTFSSTSNAPDATYMRNKSTAPTNVTYPTLPNGKKVPNQGGDPGPYIEIPNINSPVGSIRIITSTSKSSPADLNLTIDYTDVTQSEYRRTLTNVATDNMQILKNTPYTQFKRCDYCGNVGKIRICFILNPNQYVQIKSIVLNDPIPFSFSFGRVAFLFLIPLFLFLFIKAPFMKRSLDKCRWKHSLVIAITTFLFASFLVGIVIFYTGAYLQGDKNLMHIDVGDETTQEMVNSIIHHQVSISPRPSKTLLDLNNPYDYTERVQTGIKFKWDHLLYNGKYYSYYGIAPIVLVYVPYTLITGTYIPVAAACALFGFIAAIFLGLSYMQIIRKFLPKTPFNFAYGGLLILLFSAGFFACVCRPLMYEAAELSTIMFATIGIYFMMKSNIVGNGKIKLGFLTAATAFFGLAVLARATFVLYVLCVIPWLVYGFFKAKKSTDDLTLNSKNKSKKKITVQYLIAALLPLIFFGLIQASYNFIRFGSPFDFGIEYSLTINDFLHFTPSITKVFIAIWNFLLATPAFSMTFPFFQGNAESFGLNGYYFSESFVMWGALWRIPVLFMLLKLNTARRQLPDRKTRIKGFWLLVLPCILIPLSCILITWQSGYAARYNIDFAWQMTLGALAVTFFLYNNCKKPEIKKLAVKLFVACVVVGVIFNLLFLAMYIPGITNTIYKIQGNSIPYYQIARRFMFWL